jgi:glycosyltransferase involved in cell wall biosynthesis
MPISVLCATKARCMTDILAVGNLPPPVHGQSLATERMITLLRGEGFDIAVRDIGPGDANRSRVVRRLGLHMVAALALLKSRAPLAYLPVNNGSAMALTAMLCLCARLSGKALALHHHSLSYVTQPSGVMRVLIRIAGGNALHIVQSDAIGDWMASIYGLGHFLGYSNIGIVEDAGDGGIPRTPVDAQTAITMGYLANVTAEKGIYVVLDSFAKLRETRDDLRLVIAGPCRDAAIVAAMAESRARFGEALEWIGAVYSSEKQAFFEQLDIFVFPTLYATETQGMVNLEALRAGVPVVAFNRGRIGEDIGTSGGVAVPIDDDFAKALEEFVSGFQRTAMRTAARSRYDQLLQEHAAERARLLEWMRFQIYQPQP